MTRGERRLLIDTSLLGLALTLLIVALEIGGVLEPLERFSYDYRVRHCQYFTPPPTDKLVHLDIDDRSLESIGRWPWSRSVHAEILDELRLAGCKTVCYDVIFPEPEPTGYRPLPETRFSTEVARWLVGVQAYVASLTGGEPPATRPVDVEEIVEARPVEHDEVFAEGLERYGRAIIPVSLQLLTPPKSAIYRAVVTELYANPELEIQEVVDRLKAKGTVTATRGESEVRESFLTARRDAIYDRIVAEAARGVAGIEEMQARILPRVAGHIGGTPQLSALRSQYERYLAVRALHRFAQPAQDGLPPLLTASDEQASIWRLTDRSIESGYVNYLPLGDGIVRIVPLVVQHRGHLVPQMGLALACATLDVPFKDVQFSGNRIVLPRRDGEAIEIPVRSHQTPQGRFGMFFDIPWFGRRDWETMYDHPAYERSLRHVSLAFVWEARQIRERIVRNNARADEAISFVLSQIDLDRFYEYRKNLPPPEDSLAREQMMEWALKKLAADGTIEFFKQMDPAEATEEERIIIQKMLQTPDAFARILEQNRASRTDLEYRRGELRKELADKAALIGYIAVAAVADQVPTSVHARCPGVVIHGVVFNAIMTGDFWTATAPWVSVVLTIVLGSLTTVIVVSLTPWRALAGAGVLAGGYLLYNGLYFFDYRNLIVEVAGPVTAIGAVWAGGTFARYLLEAYERARVKQRFEHYVDPTLVEHVLETDDPMDGVKKELTVVFTDLQGFTTLSEALGEKTVGMLNEYMSLMVPVIRKHRGYLNKYLGDGIMYFFGAPRPNADHAYDAVASVLEMQEVMLEFNKGLVERNLPTLITRAGISAGEMIVGDAGSAQFGSDYTVLGDAVNLGARLESANKFFGTKILLNERARTMVGDRVLTRPVGKLQVVGKKEGVMTFEAIALAAKATEKQKELARLTTEMVTAYIGGKFEKCMGFVEEIERGFGTSKLTELYRSMCEQNLVEVPSDFSGQIVLTAK